MSIGPGFLIFIHKPDPQATGKKFKPYTDEEELIFALLMVILSD